MKKPQGSHSPEAKKCPTELVGSSPRLELKVGAGRSFRPSKLRPCSSSVRLRSSATWKLGWAPKEANTPPVFGFIRVTHITGNWPPREASFTSTGDRKSVV